MIFPKIKFLIQKLFNKLMLRFYTGGILGYFSGEFFAGEEVNKIGKIPSLLFNFGNWQFHLHHWLVALILLLSLWLSLAKKNKLNPFFKLFLFGYLSGLIFQGILSYSDWNKILIRQ
jgi:hypothetical protein